MVRPEPRVFRADHRLRKFVGAFKIAIFLAATVPLVADPVVLPLFANDVDI